MKIKSISKKLIICFIIFLILFNFMIASLKNANIVWAATDEEIATEAEEETNSLIDGSLNSLGQVIQWFIRALINGSSRLLQNLSYFVINTAGHGNNDVSSTITPFDIFFNKFTLTNVNIFQTDDIENTTGGNMVYQIREMVALLYYIARLIAIGILLITLICIAIKAALATLAEKKAEAKRMFVNWLVNVALLFLVDMLMVLLINFNEFIVGILANVAEEIDISAMISSLSSASFSVSFLLGWGATIAYAILAIQTMFFTCIYIIRFFKVSFFIVLAPVAALTYSIDKANSGKAIGFNKWLKEFCANIFVQSVHCVIYVIIIAVPMSAISSVTVDSITSLTLPLILCIALLFVPKAEKILMSIFGLDDSISVTTINSSVNNVKNAVSTGISMTNGTYALNTTVNNNSNNNNNKITFGTNIGNAISDKVHTYRDKATNWLDNKGINSNLIRNFGNNNSLATSIGGVLSRNQNQNQNQDQDQSQTYNKNNYNEDEDDDNIIDVPYKEVDIDDDEQQPALANTQQDVPILALPQNDLDTEKVAEAVASTQHEDDKVVEEKEEEVEINKENLEEFFKDENFFSRVRYDKGKEVANHLDDKEKEDFIKDLEEILNAYKNGQVGLDEILKRFNEHNLKYDDKVLQDLFDKFGLKMPENLDKSDETKKLTATELTEENLEKFIKENNIISNWKNEANYREPAVKKEFSNDLMDALQKYKDGKIGIDDIKKRFSAYGLEVDDNTINNLIKEFAPKKLEADSQEKNLPQVIEDNKEEKSQLEVVDGEVVEGDIVDIGGIRLPKRDMNRVMLSTRNQTIQAAKMLEILDADITAEGDLSQKGLERFNVKLLTKVNNGGLSQSNFDEAEEAVKREGDIAVKRLENFRREQTEANARMLTPAGKNLVALEIEAQQAGLFLAEARIQTSSSLSESRYQSMSTTRETMNVPTNNMPPTNQSGNVLNDLNNRKKYA